VVAAVLCFVILACSVSDGHAASPDATGYLPPALPWDGKSRALALPPDHPWATPCERSELTRTPRYDETVAWLRRLVAASPELELTSIGRSAEGRDIWMVVAARGGSRTPEALRASGKPIVLAQAGIHAGEIDGKDAGLMLLRDMTVLASGRQLLDKVHLLFIPILSVDGHERFSGYNRINQRGPEQTGWRTNARNLNLNRDYTKLETEEIRAVVAVINRWRPDLYIDLHVTDGADYQYDVTWGMTPDYGWSGHIARWMDEALAPAVNGRMVEMGHLPGPFVWPRNGRDLSEGIVVWMGAPRFSNGYGAARHLPTILVENHSLKPYDQRVLGTYVFLEGTLDFVGREYSSLRAAVEKDRRRRPGRVVLSWKNGKQSKTESKRLLGVRSEIFESPVTGGEVVRWTGKTVEQEVAVVHQSVPAIVVDRPADYYIPAGWSHIAEKLRLHGIELETLDNPTTVDVQMYRLPEAGFAGGGSAFHSLELPPGSFRAGTDQPLGELLVMLLEPESPDSLFQWGFFLEILTQPEYAEAYVMEPMARAMLEDDPQLARAFSRKLADDPEFAANPRARLAWFYRRTSYFDSRYRLYPIARSRGK
jgi:murein tripeptide amidase MpaA